MVWHRDCCIAAMTTLSKLHTPGGAYVIGRLPAADAPAVLEHLVALAPADRALRFGAAFDDAALARYVASIDFGGGAVLGAHAPDGTLAAVAHVALGHGVAELGLSVDGAHRRRGVAGALAAAALRDAQRRGAHEFRVHCAAGNVGMRRIAQRLGMELRADGAEVLASRRLKAAEAPHAATALAA